MRKRLTSRYTWALLALSATAVAQNKEVTLDHTGISNSVNVSMSFPGGSGAYVAGINNFTVVSQSPGSPLITGPLQLFCVDLSDSLNQASVVYTYDDLNVNTSSNFTSPAFLQDPAKVKNLEILYFNSFGNGVYDPLANILASSIYTVSERMAAFQVAVWELSRDTNFNLAGPNYSATGPANVIAAANVLLSGVQAALADLVDDNLQRRALSGLVQDGGLAANQSQTGQDFLIPTNPGVVIPEPQTYALIAGLSAFAVAAMRRRNGRSIATV